MSSWHDTPHYPQDDGALCCCEYYNRRGERAHILALCCACDELDAAADALLRGRRVENDHTDEVIREIDDRLRLPLPGGAWHIGLPGAVPWLVLPWLLLLGSISARCLLVAALLVFPTVLWWHTRALRLRRRSRFLMCWMIASLTYEAAVYACTVARSANALASSIWFGCLGMSVALFVHCRTIDPTRTERIADARGALRRSGYCALTTLNVPRYDHYCAWIDASVGAANHRPARGLQQQCFTSCRGLQQKCLLACPCMPISRRPLRPFLAFVCSLLLTCALGSAQYFQHAARRGWSVSALKSNQSCLTAACALYGVAVTSALAALLLHQVTSGEARWGNGAVHAPSRGLLWMSVLRRVADFCLAEGCGFLSCGGVRICVLRRVADLCLADCCGLLSCGRLHLRTPTTHDTYLTPITIAPCHSLSIR